MTLSTLMSKDGLAKYVTATPATVATPQKMRIEGVARVATVAVATTKTVKENLIKFVQCCCIGFPVTAHQVIDNLLSSADEQDIINGAIPTESLRLHIERWIKAGKPNYSGKELR